MTPSLASAATALAFLCLAGPAAAAQDCHILQQLNSLAMTPVPGGTRMLVPVSLNGMPKKLLLSTAGGLTTLNDATVQALDLHLKSSDSRLLDTAGNTSKRYVEVNNFAMGNMHAAKADFFITPDRKAGREPPNDGVLNAGLLYRYDVEMDFAGGKLNYFSPDHCDGQVVYWRTPVIGTVPIAIRQRLDDNTRHGEIILHPLVTMSDSNGDNSDMAAEATDTGGTGTSNVSWMDPLFQFNGPGIAGSDIQIHVLLDGKSFTANIDTNLEHSTLNSNAAKAAFDVTENSPGSAPASTLTEDGAKPAGETVTVFGERTFEHTFHTLSFDGVTVTNPHFMVRPDLTGRHDPENDNIAGSHIFNADDNVEPDISIGMDVLRQLHLYFAFKERRLYVTPAS